jgi:hypothetical protein
MDPITTYFEAERAESALFLIVGLLALGVAAWGTWRSRRPWLAGAAWPLTAVALVQITVGASIWLRSPHDAARVHQIVQLAPQRLYSEEIPRMRQVMANFEIYRSLEIGLLATGLLLAAMTARRPAWRGAGLGLALQAALMLLLDFFAEARGRTYLAWLMTQMT